MTNQEKQESIDSHPIEEHAPEKGEDSRLERLIKEIEKMNGLLKHTFSWKTVIFRGVITGLFTVIGATIIASLLFSFLTMLFGDSIPFLSNLLEGRNQ